MPVLLQFTLKGFSADLVSRTDLGQNINIDLINSIIELLVLAKPSYLEKLLD